MFSLNKSFLHFFLYCLWRTLTVNLLQTVSSRNRPQPATDLHLPPTTTLGYSVGWRGSLGSRSGLDEACHSLTLPPRPPPGSQGAAVRSYQDYCAAVLQQHISSSVVVACFGVTVQHNRFIKTLKWRTFENEHRAARLLTPALH